MFMILSQNYAGSKQMSHKVMEAKLFPMKAKARPDTENIPGLNLAVVKPTTAQMTKLRF
jgi:hypothetical protein